MQEHPILLVRPLSGVSVREALFFSLAAFIVAYPFLLDRGGMVDQVNYLDAFANTPDFSWLQSLVKPELAIGALFRLFTEEVVWLMWTTILGLVFSPDVAVYLTVAVLNLLVVLAAREYRHPWLALLLWIGIPQALAVVGVYQIRQGLAFAVLLYFGARHGRLILGALLAAMIHTTFAIVLPFAILTSMRAPAWVKLLTTLAVAVTLASVGGALFEEYGGRRIETYLVDEGTTSLNFVLSLLIPLPYVIWLQLTGSNPTSISRNWPLRGFDLIYIGIISFLVASVFLFPLGTARLAYYLTIGLIPILANLRYGKLLEGRLASLGVLLGVIPTVALIFYIAFRAAEDDRYACLTTKNCADVLFSK